KKHADIGALLSGKKFEDQGKINEYCLLLVEILDKWTKELKIERLGKYGISKKDIDKIVDRSGLKNNPVNLSKNDIKTILTNRL
ncbi:MAG: alcohol dehydrogenase, partial [Candidatus Thorarchaeota archaeon]